MFSTILRSVILISLFIWLASIEAQAQATCPSISNYYPRIGYPGYGLTILGKDLGGVTEIQFAGNVPASFNLLNEKEIAVIIPLNAMSGPVTIRKPGCADAVTGLFIVPPGPELSLAPASQNIPFGSPGLMSVNFPSALFATTMITLESSNPSGVAVPPFLVVPQGSISASFNVTGIAAGATATITATLPPNLGGATAAAIVSFISPLVRAVRIPGAIGSAGRFLNVPIHINSQGDENAIQFSLSFDPAVLSNPQASLGMSLGSGTISAFTEQVAQGRLGVVLEFPPGESLPAGDKQILMLRFSISPSAPGGETAIAFDDLPKERRINSPAGLRLLASFTSGPVMIEPSKLEITLSPQSQAIPVGGMGRVAVNLNQTQTAPATIMLVSSNPAGVSVPATVMVQQNANSAVFDVTGIAAGESATIIATLPASLGGASATASVFVIAPVVRGVKIPGAIGRVGGTLDVPIELDAQGDENEIRLSLAFDPAVLGNPQSGLGMSLGNGDISVFTGQLAEGRIGIVLAFPPGQTIPAGNKQILMVRFAIDPGAKAGQTVINFSDQPTARQIKSAGGTTLAASYQSGPIKIER